MTKYRAKYIPRQDRSLPTYWRTITNAETLGEATRIAERYTRKGYICCTITQEQR